MHNIKIIVRKILCLPPVNAVIKLFRVPLRKLFSAENIMRIPIRGEVSVQLTDTTRFRLLSDGSDRIASQIFWLGLDGYDKKTMPLFIQLARKSKMILDIGANTGIYSLVAASAQSQAQVFAFEPVPGIFASLQRNANGNRFADLECIEAALSDADGEITLYVPSNFVTFPLTASTVEGYREECKFLKVISMKIDSFVRSRGLTGVDLIKLDTESTEHLVIAGGIETITACLPIMICEVLPDNNESHLHKLLDQLHYRYFWITSTGLIRMQEIKGDPTFQDSNYLFVPDSKLKEVSSWLGQDLAALPVAN